MKVMSHGNGSLIRSALKRDSVVDCSSLLRGYKNRLTRTLNMELQAASLHGSRFTVVKYACVNMSVLTTPSKLAAKIGIPPGDDVSIIVVNWRGTSKNTVITNSATGAHLNKRVSMTGVCQTDNVSVLISEVLPHSDLVSRTAGEFAKSIGLRPGEKFIAVHLRSEKIGLRETRFPNALRACTDELMALRTKLKNAHPNMSIIDMTDFGPYSSGTCKNCWSATMAEKIYKELGIESTHFDPVLFNVPIDRGFAAAVDAELLASSSYLVLCGGGAFQNQAALQFLRNGKTSDRLIQVCMTDSSVSTVLKKSN